MTTIVKLGIEEDQYSDLEDLDRIVVDAEPLRLLVVSEPFLIYNQFGYQPSIMVFNVKKKGEYILFLSAKSLANQIEELRKQNNGCFTGLEFWIHKESYDKKSPYIVRSY